MRYLRLSALYARRLVAEHVCTIVGELYFLPSLMFEVLSALDL